MATAARPTLAGSYFDWEAQGRVATPPSIGGIVVVPATSHWGPVNVCKTYESEDAFEVDFTGDDSDLSRAVHDAFRGQGVPGKGGAGAVLVYRMAASDAAKAAHTIANTAGSPASALTLTAKHEGTRGNDFRFTSQAGPSGTKDFLILDGALVVESYNYPQTDIVALAALINASSDWFTAAELVTGVALANVSAVAATGGLDGGTLDGGDWTDMFAALDRERWAILAAYGLTDGTIRASLAAYIVNRNALGVRCFAVVGGASGETISDANTRSSAINNWDIMNLGRGTLHLTDADRDVSTAEFVARYAGGRAWRGEARDDIFMRFADVELLDGPTLDEEGQALDGGTIVFSRDTNVTAPVFIREAVNTYADDSQSPVDQQGNKIRPVDLWKRIKNIAIQHGIETSVSRTVENGDWLGDLPNTDKGRQQVLSLVRSEYDLREKAQIVQPGWTVDVAAGASDDDDFVTYVHSFKDVRTLRQIFNQARVG